MNGYHHRRHRNGGRGGAVKRGIINPGSTSSLVLFLLGSIVAGFAAGLGWGLAFRLINRGGNRMMRVIDEEKADRALRGRVFPGPLGMIIGR